MELASLAIRRVHTGIQADIGPGKGIVRCSWPTSLLCRHL